MVLMKRRVLIKKLEAAGEDRNEGGHSIYEKKGSRSVQVPNHREINEYTSEAILKAAGAQ
jgi:predicted RNA binding protein YcfA (HicA-like mRNA interferase family)